MIFEQEREMFRRKYTQAMEVFEEQDFHVQPGLGDGDDDTASRDGPNEVSPCSLTEDSMEIDLEFVVSGERSSRVRGWNGTGTHDSAPLHACRILYFSGRYLCFHYC